MSPDFDEQQLTAYALGELDESARPHIEALLRQSPYARSYVQSVSATVQQLTGELAGEEVAGLTAIQQASLEQRINQAAGREPAAQRSRRRWERIVLAGSIAASILIVGFTAALFLPAIYRQFDSTHDDSQAVAHLPYIISNGSPQVPSLPSPAGLTSARPPGPRIDQSDDAGHWPGKSSGPVVSIPAAAPQDDPLQSPANVSRSGIPIATLRLISGDLRLWPEDAPASVHPTVTPRLVAAKPEWFAADVSSSPAPPDIDTGSKLAPPVDPDAYDHFADNPFSTAANYPLSAFAPEVGYASYCNIRRSLARGELPPPNAVRVEEMLNYFSWRPAKPAGDGVMSGDVELSVCPWNTQHRLARIVLQTRSINPETRPPVNLVFLVDVSSSMSSQDKLPLVQRGLKLLLSQLGRRDRVGFVAAPQQAGFLLPPTSGDQHLAILDAIDRLSAGNTPAAGAGLETAYYAAGSSYIPGGINRVVLVTDGRWLAGAANPEALARAVKVGAATGVSLDVIAVSPTHLNDPALRHLASVGKGTLSIVDTLTDARKELFNLANGSLIDAARDVRIAVKVNPIAVESYRLIGYESHQLSDSDAIQESGADLGVGHMATALYELVPANGADGSPLAVTVRYKLPGSEAEQILNFAAPVRSTALSKASNDFDFASAVAEFSMTLRPSEYAGNASFASALDLAQRGQATDEDRSRGEFVDLIRRAEKITGQPGN